MKDQYDFVKSIYLSLKKRELLPPLKPLDIWSPQISTILKKNNEIPKPVVSALALWNDDLFLSHEISQGINSSVGSWLHGCMHRREGDFSNSKYWYRKAGNHTCFSKMTREVDRFLVQFPRLIEAELGSLRKAWNPFDFIDLCSAVSDESTDLHAILKQAQLIELELLLEITIKENLG